MRIPFFARATLEEPKPEFAYCESARAIFNTWHIRRLGPDGELHLGGGIDTGPVAGCWDGNGWDINVPFDLDEAVKLSETRPHYGGYGACPKCVAVLLEESS